mmetsp:Transcript_34164/g.96254  ORF Transcript_34164/g.96254 Transcript_34164/m.96254 type:complete len:297 (-) Transcript_34164:851-1741(-)
MQVVEVLAVDKQVQHVVTLATDLESRFDPVDLRGLEELGGLERLEEVPLLHGLGRAVLQGVEHVGLEQFLVADAHLHRLVGGAMLPVPGLDQGHVDGAASVSGAEAEGVRSPVARDARRGLVRVQEAVGEKRLNVLVQHKVIRVLVVFGQALLELGAAPLARGVARRNGVDEGVPEVCGQGRVLGFHVAHRRVVVRGHIHFAGTVVVQEGERDAALGANGVPDDDLVNVVELVPVLVRGIRVAEEGLELGATRNGQVERLGGEERLEVEEVKVVGISEVAQQLAREAVQRGHLWYR